MAKRLVGILLALGLAGMAGAFAQNAPATPVPAPQATPAAKSTPPEAAPEEKPLQQAVDSLSDADLKDFITILKDYYVAPEKISETEISRATVQGLIDRLAPGISLVPATREAAAIGPFRSEVLREKTGYVRLGAFDAGNIAELDATLQKFREQELESLVLDLRAVPPGSEFEQAAELCKRFCPKGRVLFTVRKPSARQESILTSKDDPLFTGLLIVLLDADSAGASEVSAAVLRTHAKALVVGQRSKGEAVEFAEVPLPSGVKVRIAVAEVALPENVKVFPGGVLPDVVVQVTPAETKEVLQAGLQHGVAKLVEEKERPRMNEAALVAGRNPELEALEQAQKAEKEEKVPRDVALQRALDLVTTIGIFQDRGPKR